MELARASSVDKELPPVLTTTRKSSIDKVASVLGEPVRPLGTFIEVSSKPPATVDLRIVACVALLTFLAGAAFAVFFYELTHPHDCSNRTLQ